MNNLPMPIPFINFDIINEINILKERVRILEEKINNSDDYNSNYLEKDDNYYMI